MKNYQEATNQLLAINAQRKSNLSEAKASEMINEAQNNTLSQASGIIASQSPEEIQSVNASLNPATQNILGQYGLGKPRIQKTNSSSQQVNKQNIVINNKNTTITNNNVQVPAGIGGPVQGRPIQFQDRSNIRLKTWLSNTFAQQNELSEKRKREYEKRDSALTRNSNKLMRKLEEAGKNISSTMNPKNMASSMGNQLKTLLYVFGFAHLAKKWPEMLDKVEDIKIKVEEFKNKVAGFFSKDGTFVEMLGGKKGETVIGALKNLFIDKDDGIIAYIKKWLGDRMQERGTAIKGINKPDTSWKKGSGVENNITRILGNVVDYLGNILGAIVDPSKVAEKTTKQAAETESKEYEENNSRELGKKESITVWDPYAKNGKGSHVGVKASRGDMAIVEGDYKGLKRGSLDKSGNLISSPAASISQAAEIERAIKTSKTTGNIKTASVATGFSRLMDVAKRDNTVALSEDFLKEHLKEEDLKELGLTKPSPYVYVVRPKTEEEMYMDLLAISKDNKNLRKNIRNGSAKVGLTLGGIPGSIAGSITGGFLGYSISEIREDFQKSGLPDTVIELRKGNNAGDAGVDESKGEHIVEDPNVKPPRIYDVTPETLQKIVDKITGTQNINVDLGDTDFVKSIENYLTKDIEVKSKDIDVDKTYAANTMIKKNKEEEAAMREISRAKRATQKTKEVGKEVVDSVSKKISSSTPTKSSSTPKSSPSSTTSTNTIKEGWGKIRINKKDGKTAHAGTGAVGKENINKEYLTDLLTREISGEFGRKEGNPNGCYINPQDGGKQAGHGNYGYGNTYNTLKEWYKGPVSFKLADGTIKKFDNLELADAWFVKYCKDNNTYGSKPANKKVVLTDETAAAINKMSIGKFVDSALKMDPEIMGAMDEQTLGGLLHINYGGNARYKKLISFYKNHKQEALDDLAANNGVHSEDFVNQIMMNTSEGASALQTDNKNGTHFDRRGYLTGYHAFGVYSAKEWSDHLAKSGASTEPEKEDLAQNNTRGTVLPEINISTDSLNSAPATFTPNNNISSNYSSIAQQENEGSSGFSEVAKSDTANYIPILNDIEQNLIIIKETLNINGKTAASTLVATGNVTEAIRNIAKSGQHIKNTAKDMTEEKYS